MGGDEVGEVAAGEGEGGLGLAVDGYIAAVVVVVVVVVGGGGGGGCGGGGCGVGGAS